MEITAGQCGDVTNLTCTISLPGSGGGSQRDTVIYDFLNKVQLQMIHIISLQTGHWFSRHLSSHPFNSVLCFRGDFFCAFMETILTVCELSECCFNKLSYLVQQGVSGWLVKA